ncbi:cyclic peptide export ABC transporter [Janthinobacterium sp. PSPC1-1]|uniref:cyclic peptide export ABC transporter n=1 Tax=Janthinobacterium sp. PSPC1-1 TaxID=2804581 RepID=UPI003CF33729
MELKRLSDLFWKSSPNIFFISIVLGAITGVLYSLLVPFLMYSVSTDVDVAETRTLVAPSFSETPTSTLAIAFFATCLFIVIMKGLFTVLSMYVANQASVQHRLWLYRRIGMLKLIDLERIGHSRLINILNIDIPTITAGAVGLPQIWISIVTVMGVMGYLVHLNMRVFWFVMAALVIAILTYQIPLMIVTRLFQNSRESYDFVQQGVSGLVYGAKELKLNRKKYEAYFEQELLFPENNSLRDNLKGNLFVIFLQSYGEVISFLVIGIVVFYFRYIFAMTSNELLGIAMALLYLVGPVGLILSAMGTVRRGQISLQKLHEFYQEITVGVSDNVSVDVPAWEWMEVRDVSYSYSENESDFGLRNVNLRFLRGQISFIVGGNGSGKSTLSKCLSFHYYPSSGKILLGKTIIDGANIESGRRFVSAIFSDYYLFKRLYIDQGEIRIGEIEKYLKYLELDKKVSMVGDCFTTTNLSDGQKKRLALLVMLVEDRDICIFDEWAADQDPRFKEIFYTKILPDLKRKNKVIIVISHDDRYYKYADQIVTMENGGVGNVELKDIGVAEVAVEC